MKVKTSITLSDDLVDDLERYQERFGSRSAMIEIALRRLLDSLAREARDTRDREILEREAKRFEAEATDALAYQAED